MTKKTRDNEPDHRFDLSPDTHLQFRATIPEFSLAGLPEAKFLAGDFVLTAAQLHNAWMAWLRFEPVCGYSRLLLRLVSGSNEDGWLISLTLFGGPEAAVWQVDSVTDLQSLHYLTLQNVARFSDWPTKLSLQWLSGSASNTLPSFTRILSSSDNCSQLCDCWGAGFQQVKVSYEGISDADCTHSPACSYFNQEFTLDLSEVEDCLWMLDLVPAVCGTYEWMSFEIYPTPNEDCKISLVATIWESSYPIGIYIKEVERSRLDVSVEYELSLDEWDPVDASCDGSNSTAYVSFPICEMPQEIDCWNKLCRRPASVNTPARLADCELTVQCCCGPECGGSSIDVCAPGERLGGGCGAEGCSYLSVFDGTVRAELSVPGFGSGTLSGNLYLTTQPGTTGTSSRLIIDEYLIENVDERSARVFKCDHAALYYICRDLSTGEYLSVGSNSNRLKKNTDGTHTETQVNGLLYDFDSSGILFRIRNPLCSTSTSVAASTSPATWTIMHDVGTSNVSSPFGQRTTFSYDGNGNLKRVEDPYNRLTSFVFSSSGVPTEHISPELCTTELRYDGSDRIESVIAPDGTRTSYSYDSNGLVSRLQLPSGGLFTYQYSGATTTVTDPQSKVTTLQYDSYRNVVSKTTPLGNQSALRYEKDLLTVEIPAAGPRTTYAYQTLGQNVRMIKAKVTPMGRETFVYDSNDWNVARISALGQRTTLVRSASGKLLAEIDPLNQRTTYVHATGGQAIAMVNPLGQRSSYTYTSLLQTQSTINPLGNRTTYSYLRGQRIATRNPLNQLTSAIYDLSNRPVATVDGNGSRTTVVYDAGGHAVANIQPSGARTTNIYAARLLAATVNPLANRTSFTYDRSESRIGVVSPMSRLTTYVYDDDRRQVAVVAPTGLRSSTIYDAGNRPVASVAPTGLRTTSVFGTSTDLPLATVSPDGTRTSFTYNAANLQIHQIAPSGGITTTIYDANEQPIATINALGQRSTTVYDAAGRATADVNALGQRTSMVYDSAGQVTATVNPLGNRSSQVYDAAGLAVASVNPLNNHWTSIYDAAGRNIARVDPLLRRTSTIYDADSRVVASVNALGYRSTTIYSAASQTVATVDARGYRTSMTYNADGQSTATQNALGYRTTNIYDSGGRQAAVLNARGNRTSTIYGSGGRPVATQNPLGYRWTTVYNGKGQVAASVNPLGNRTTSVYDTAGRQSATIQPLGERSTMVYNVANQTIAKVDANNHRRTMVYDALGREQAQVDPLGNRTTNVFNAAGQTIALVDARANRHSFTYDAAGAQTQQIDALGRRTTLGYDAAGQQTRRLDARGYRTTYVYDSVSQVIGRRYPDGGRATFTYDATGNRTLVRDSTGRYTFTYDALGLIASANNPENKSLAYTYDAVSNRRSMQSSDSGRFTYSYDVANQNTVVLNPFGERSTFSYDSAGRQTIRRLSNGTRTSTAYDASSRRTQVDNLTSAGAAIATFNYKYDSVGNPTRVVEASGDRVTWSYDEGNRLLAERRSGASSYANTFTYDASGNRTVVNVGSSRTTFAYDAANQLSYSQGIGGRTTYAFDANGNQTLERTPAGSRTTTTWDYENQPLVYRLPDTSRVTLAYNADNRRVQKQSAAGTVKFVWDPSADAYQSEVDVSNVTQAVYTSPPAQYGQLISQRRGATSHWFHPNSLGSTAALTNSVQTTTDFYLYDAWGNPLSSSGSAVNPFRWVGSVGYYFDSETGLFYIRARTYQPTIARWTSVDPLFYMLATAGAIGLGSSEGTHSNEANGNDSVVLLYQYGRNNPLGLFDPSGESTVVVGAVAGCLAGAGISVIGGWLRGRSTRNQLCRAGVGCLLGVLPGVIGGANPTPATLKCMAAITYSLSSTIPGAICDKLTGNCSAEESWQRIGCAALKTSIGGLVGCLANHADPGLQQRLLGLTAGIWGVDFALYCQLQDAILA